MMPSADICVEIVPIQCCFTSEIDRQAGDRRRSPNGRCVPEHEIAAAIAAARSGFGSSPSTLGGGAFDAGCKATSPGITTTDTPRLPTASSAFVDPSGGRHDAFTMAIGHREGTGSGTYNVIDVIRGVAPPFDPQNVVEEYATLLKDYKIHLVTGDNYSAAWAESTFTKAGIRYVRSEQNKSQLYIEALPLFVRQSISIPNHPKLVRELRLLERRTSRMGRDSVDHGPHGTDDFANSVAGVLRSLSSNVDLNMSWISGDEDENQDGRRTYAAEMLSSYLRSHGIMA